MANIDVEERSPSVWPWIVGLLVLALLVWALVEMFGRATEPVVREPVTDTLGVDTGLVAPPVVAPADTLIIPPDTMPPADTLTPAMPTDTV